MRAQKIDSTILESFKIVIAAFLIYNRAKKICFFKKIFLLADFNINMALGILFHILSNTNIHFTD